MLHKIKLIAVSLMFSVLAACSYVEPGEVGILVNKVGGDKGVEQNVLPVGRYWLTPNEYLYTFDTFVQTHSWTQGYENESEGDESFTFESKDGMHVGVDMGISYRVIESAVPAVFQRYRMGLPEVTDGPMRSVVRDALQKEGEQLTTYQLYSGGKAGLMKAVEGRVREKLGMYFDIEQIFLIGALRYPQSVQDAIQAKVKAEEKIIQLNSEVYQQKAEADKAIEDARGKAESIKKVADAEAYAIDVVGKALRENPNVIENTLAESWDGKLPTVTGSGGVPLLNIDKLKK